MADLENNCEISFNRSGSCFPWRFCTCCCRRMVRRMSFSRNRWCRLSDVEIRNSKPSMQYVPGSSSYSSCFVRSLIVFRFSSSNATKSFSWYQIGSSMRMHSRIVGGAEEKLTFFFAKTNIFLNLSFIVDVVLQFKNGLSDCGLSVNCSWFRET